MAAAPKQGNLEENGKRLYGTVSGWGGNDDVVVAIKGSIASTYGEASRALLSAASRSLLLVRAVAELLPFYSNQQAEPHGPGVLCITGGC